jgi:histidine triad (HIT) family protein
LAIPKLHAATLGELSDFSMIDKLFAVMKKLARDAGIDETGYRIVLNQGRDAGQAVSHLHFHLLGGRSMHWPPG